MMTERTTPAPRPSAPADRDLRERIAVVLAEADGWEYAEAHGLRTASASTQQHYDKLAAAVLAVLPSSASPAPRVTSHAYEGDGGPCSAEAYGQTCGAPRDAHQLDERPAPQCAEFVPDTPRAPGLCATCGDERRWHQPAPAPLPPEREAERRARYEAAFGPNMRLGLQDAELHDEPGAQRINEWITWITDAVMAVTDAEQAELRAKLAELEASGAVVCDAEGCAIPHTPGCPKNSSSLIRPVRYEVSVVPEDDINHDLYVLAVEDRGAGRWAVVRHRQCLGTDGTWDWESIPSEREDAWLDTHRFDLETALRLAEEAAPKVTVGGITAAEVAARAAEGSDH